jgi:hypothetical protein
VVLKQHNVCVRWKQNNVKKGKTNAMVSKRGMGERFNMQTINAHKVNVFVFLD